MQKQRGELKKASDLFEKYRKVLIAPERTVINAFLEVVDDLLSIKFSSDKLRYNPDTKTLSFVGAGLLKSEIKMHETEILAHLKGRLGERSVPRLIL